MLFALFQVFLRLIYVWQLFFGSLCYNVLVPLLIESTIQSYLSTHHTYGLQNLPNPVPVHFFKDFIYLFLDRGEGREKERKRSIRVWLPLPYPPPGAWPTTQACALTGNPTGDSLVHRPVLNPLSHTSQGYLCILTRKKMFQHTVLAWDSAQDSSHLLVLVRVTMPQYCPPPTRENASSFVACSVFISLGIRHEVQNKLTISTMVPL